MDSSTRVILAGARYSTKAAAVNDYESIWAARRNSAFGHLSVAVLTKDETGELEVERHNSSTKKLAWGGAALGAALVLVAPPAGFAALAATGGTMAGAGAIVGHFWRSMDRETINQVGDLLRSGQSAILLVAVEPDGTDISSLLVNSDHIVVVQTNAGDIDSAFQAAVSQSERQPT